MDCPCQDLDVDLDRPKYCLNKYWGRFAHCLASQNPLNFFRTRSSLERYKEIILKYRCHEPLPSCITESQLWRAKYIFDSAYDEYGELMPRMTHASAFIPMNVLLLGGMFAFSKTIPAIAFWQWLYQSYLHYVHYKRRGYNRFPTNGQINYSYIVGTTTAVGTGIALSSFAKRYPPIVGRFVPFAALAAATLLSVPILRAQNLKDGIPISNHWSQNLAVSRTAAQNSVMQEMVAKTAVLAPAMVITPYIMNHLERRGTLCRYPWIKLPASLGAMALGLTLLAPFVCAMFSSPRQMNFCDLEPEIRDKLERKLGDRAPYLVFYRRTMEN